MEAMNRFHEKIYERRAGTADRADLIDLILVPDLDFDPDLRQERTNVGFILLADRTVRDPARDA